MAAKRKDPPEPIEYPLVTLKFRDLFVFKDLYGAMYSWLKHEGWVDKVSGSSVDYVEEFYLEKIGSTGAKDHIIYWELEKFMGDYFKYSMSIGISTIFLNTTEMMQDGKKIKADIGDLKITIQVRLHPDYKGEWTNHFLFGPFHDHVKETIFKGDFTYHKQKLYKQLYEFQAEIKRYLNLKQFMGPGEGGFIPAKEV